MAMTVGFRMEIRNERLSITSKRHNRFSRYAGIGAAAGLEVWVGEASGAAAPGVRIQRTEKLIF
jgi:hypothetical protein